MIVPPPLMFAPEPALKMVLTMWTVAVPWLTLLKMPSELPLKVQALTKSVALPPTPLLAMPPPPGAELELRVLLTISSVALPLTPSL